MSNKEQEHEETKLIENTSAEICVETEVKPNQEPDVHDNVNVNLTEEGKKNIRYVYVFFLQYAFPHICFKRGFILSETGKSVSNVI